jgi:hypothetical protein
VVRLAWLAPGGSLASATFLAADDGAQDPLVRASTIVARIRRLLALDTGGEGHRMGIDRR